MAKKEEDKGRLKEPSVVVKPLGRLGGLDGIHVALIVLVAIMAALLLAVSSFNRPTQAVPNNATNRTACAYAFSNGTCASPLHNASQVRLSIERLIASYSYLNTSYALLPYITETNSMSLTYLPDSGEWYAVAPISQPGVNGTIYLSFLYNDKNSSITPFIQAVKPSLTTQNYVKSYGVVMLQGKVACSTASPLQIYWFIDPYS
ncbi:MAG: hypothetical protein M1321_00725, partial [Candidatus Marsarchaeota archaeon]|nr:hypothetical protein [Candidatus Marsarchaeota archaeon]